MTDTKPIIEALHDSMRRLREAEQEVERHRADRDHHVRALAAEGMSVPAIAASSGALSRSNVRWIIGPGRP